jgi:serine/threonine protein kinase
MMTRDPNDPAVLLKRIAKAKSFKELLDGDNAARAYRRIAKLCHPDVVPDGLKDEATIAFANLGILYGALNGAPKERSAVVAGYVVKSPLAKGDICDLYLVESIRCDDAVLKIVRSARDNDLLEREVATLKAVQAEPSTPVQHYAPQVLSSFKASGRRAIVMAHQDGYLSLEDIMAMYPAGLDFRHIVWMGNRLLSILGFIHRRGIVHGAILPPHLLYHPTSHDLCLIDWCYSAQGGATIPARVNRYAGCYPDEVGRKISAVPATDLYMMAQTLRSASALTPDRFDALFQYCTAGSPASRPDDAWSVQDMWKKLAQDQYGVPTYVPLKLNIS